MTAKIFREILAENNLTPGRMEDFEYQVQFSKMKMNRYGNPTYSCVTAYTNDRELAQHIVAEYRARAIRVPSMLATVAQRRPGTKKFGDLRPKGSK